MFGLYSPGSSPHTRGLRVRNMRTTISMGIIPAHAGFTPFPRGEGGKLRDHPRTRGVYGIRNCRTGTLMGSSPHTRGLLRKLSPDNSVDRIIPAHAGFTSRTFPERFLDEDHPRTRGVYVSRSGVHAGGVGSSPHTRGLHGGQHGETLAERIIPAHAGFTR